MDNIIFIGYKGLDGRVIAAGCPDIRFLSHTGIYLDRCYTDKDKAKCLVSNGRIEEVSQNLLSLVDSSTMKDLKTIPLTSNYTVFSKDIYPDLEVQTLVFESEVDYINDENVKASKCCYLFVEAENKWYMDFCGTRFDLHRLLQDREYFFLFFRLTEKGIDAKKRYVDSPGFVDLLYKVAWNSLLEQIRSVDKMLLPEKMKKKNVLTSVYEVNEDTGLYVTMVVAEDSPLFNDGEYLLWVYMGEPSRVPLYIGSISTIISYNQKALDDFVYGWYIEHVDDMLKEYHEAIK